MHIMLCICVRSFSPSSCFSASLIQNISQFGAKKYFIDYQTANIIQLFVPLKRKFFGSLLFQNKLQRSRILQELLDKYSHLFICISLKWALSSEQKSIYIVKILISEQTVFAAVLCFGQVFVFCRLIDKSMLEWFLPIMCK